MFLMKNTDVFRGYGHEKVLSSLLSPTISAKRCKTTKTHVDRNQFLINVTLLLSGDINVNPGPSILYNQDSSYECFQRKGLHFVHLNVCSLPLHLDEVQLLAHNTNAAVLALSETRLDSSIHDNEVVIPGYNLQKNDRKRSGGGDCMYIRNNLVFNRRNYLNCADLEFTAVDILLPKTKPILIGVYRPPSGVASQFYSKLESVLLESPTYINQETYLLGDFNRYVQK